MRKLSILAMLLCSASLAAAQGLQAANGDCSLGGQQVQTQSLLSSGTNDPNTSTVSAGGAVMASYPQCAVTVFFTGTSNKANIFSNNNPTPTPLSNPFNADAYGRFLFYAAQSCYDIVLNSGSGPTMPTPRTFTDVCLGGSSAAGTVTLFQSDATLAPLLSTTVATPTTTPFQHFSLLPAAANSVFANCTGGSGTPLFCSINVNMLPFTYSGNTTQLATVTGTLNGSAGAAVCQDGFGNLTKSGCTGGVGAVASFNGRTGAVVSQTGDYMVSQVTGAAPLNSPNLTGIPTAPTAATADTSTQLATDQFVHNVIAAIPGSGVTSWNTRTGAVVPVSGDYTVAQVTGAAPLASPTFTGTVTLPATILPDGTKLSDVSTNNYLEFGSSTASLSTATSFLALGSNTFQLTNGASANLQSDSSSNLTISGATISESSTGTMTLSAAGLRVGDSLGSVWNSATGGPQGLGTINALGLYVNGVAVSLSTFSGTVTSFSAGTLSPLFTTSVATATTTPALTFTLSNAGGGTLFGNNGTSPGAPAYTIAPVLGIPGTSTGTLALASSTASGKFSLTAPASASTPTITLPTSTAVLTESVAGDGTVLSATGCTTTAAGLCSLTLANAGGGTLLGNTGTSPGAPSYTIAPVLGIPGTSTGSIALASSTASGKYTITAPANAATPTLTLPTGSGTFAISASSPIVLNATTGNLTCPTCNVSSATVSSFSAGGLSPLFTTNVATATTTPALTFTLSNAGGGTVFANNGTVSAAPSFTISPQLGIPGTSTGTIALASSTASGLYTITAPANAATPTLTLPTTTGTFASSASSPLVLNATTGVLTCPTCNTSSANVISVSGDGALISNSASTGAVTLTLGAAPAGTVWDNNTAASGTPSYSTTLALGNQNVTAGTLKIFSSTSATTGLQLTDTGTVAEIQTLGTNENLLLQANGTGVVEIVDGSSTVPGLGIGNATTGFSRSSSTLLTIINSTVVATINSSSANILGSNGVYGISSTSPPGAADTGLSRDSAGVIDVGTGGGGSKAGTLQATTLTALTTLNVGVNGSTGGTFNINGLTSGALSQVVQSAAGTPTVTWGTNSGTPAVSASSPLAIVAATGNITCSTCATTTNGGAITGTAPISISAGGAVSITGITSITGTDTALLSAGAGASQNLLLKADANQGAIGSLVSDNGTTLTYTGTGGLALAGEVAANATATALLVQGGIDSTTASPGALTARGGSVTGGSTASLSGAAATFQGGDNASSGATEVAGAITLRGGDTTNGSAAVNTGGAVTIRGGNLSSTGASGTPGLVTIKGGQQLGAATNTPGADVLIEAGLGTGNSTPAHVKLYSDNFNSTSGSTAQTNVTWFTIHKKAGSTTSATATSMFNIAIAASQTVGAWVGVHVETTQATPQNCSTTQYFFISAQNTSSSVTQQTTASSEIATICSTGTLTLAAALSTANPTVFTVTPSWATIVPTAVIITVEIHNLSQQDVTLL